MTTVWSYLPNAAHIDRIIADLKTNPYAWATAWGESLRISASCKNVANKVFGNLDQWNAGKDIAFNHANGTMLTLTFGIPEPARSESFFAARYAILALMAWSESGDYLELPRDQVQVMATLGDQRAILMLPSVIAFAKSRELV